jgi:carbon storage regulator
MLVLTRKPGEKLIIGNGITVTLVAVRGGRVRLGIEAPGDVSVLRSELLTGPNDAASDETAVDVDLQIKPACWRDPAASDCSRPSRRAPKILRPRRLAATLPR